MARDGHNNEDGDNPICHGYVHKAYASNSFFIVQQKQTKTLQRGTCACQRFAGLNMNADRSTTEAKLHAGSSRMQLQLDAGCHEHLFPSQQIAAIWGETPTIIKPFVFENF